MKQLLVFALMLAAMLSSPVLAVQPDEILANPVLEARARDISQGLRCLVCRNENIDDSNAGLAKDLRILVRERLTAGDTNQQVVAFIVSRYGEFVLLKPRMNGINILLWASGPLMLLLALWMGVGVIRRRKTGETAELSPEEQARLQELLHD